MSSVRRCQIFQSTRWLTDFSVRHRQVKYGLFIPILLKATVTAPIAELDEGELGFGTVYVGQCKVCQLKVHNK